MSPLFFFPRLIRKPFFLALIDEQQNLGVRVPLLQVTALWSLRYIAFAVFAIVTKSIVFKTV